MKVERKSKEEAIAAGFDERMLRDDYLVPDSVVEIEPLPPKGGRIVWEWHVWDHLVQKTDRTEPNYGDPAAHPELVDVACNGRATAAFWNHMNSLDYNPALDQIVLSVRGCNEIWVIDHSTTTTRKLRATLAANRARVATFSTAGAILPPMDAEPFRTNKSSSSTTRSGFPGFFIVYRINYSKNPRRILS